MRRFKVDFGVYDLTSPAHLKETLREAGAHEISRGRAAFPRRRIRRTFVRYFRKLAARGGSPDDLESALYRGRDAIFYALDRARRDSVRAFRKLPFIGGLPRVFLFARILMQRTWGQIGRVSARETAEAFAGEAGFDYSEAVILPFAFECAALEFIAGLVTRGKTSAGGERANRGGKAASDARYGRLAFRAVSALSALKRSADIFPSGDLRNFCACDGILRGERSGVYARTAPASRDAYLREISRLSDRKNIPEIDIARAAAALADGGNDSPRDHCGYYIFRDRTALFNRLYGRTRFRKERVKFYQLLYIIPNYLTALGLGLFLGGFCPTGAPRYVYAVLAYPVFLHVSKLLNTSVLKLFGRADALPRMDFSRGIPAEARTLAVFSIMITNAEEIRAAVRRLAVNALADRDPRIGYCILADLPASGEDGLSAGDAKIISAADDALRAARRENKVRLSVYFRRRTYNEHEGDYRGRERKRGALMDLFAFFLTRGNAADYFYKVCGRGRPAPVNIAALDSDTALPPGALTRLIETAAHPLNRAYNIFSPRMRTDPLTTRDTLFSRLFGGGAGWGSYSSGDFDVYQDIFHIGVFHGKGLLRMKEFYETLKDALPENRVLSHDIIEGALAGAANVRVELYDTYPASYGEYLRRNARWARGDWQLAPYLLPRFVTASGRKRKNPLQPLSRWQLLDNIQYSLLTPAALALILASPFFGGRFWLPVATASAFYAIAFLNDIYASVKSLFRYGRFAPAVKNIREGFVRLVFNFISLPHYGITMARAVAVTLWRMIFKRNLLKWEVSAPSAARSDFEVRRRVSARDGAFLSEAARASWRYFEDALAKENNFLPPAFMDDGGKAARITSFADIGYALLSCTAALGMEFIDARRFVALAGAVLRGAEASERADGSLFLDSRRDDTLCPPTSAPRAGSAIFIAALITVRAQMRLIGGRGAAACVRLIDKSLSRTDFAAACVRENGGGRGLLIGSQLSAFIAVALYGAGSEAWTLLSRETVRGAGVLPYSRYGGLDEYLEPSLVLRYGRGSLLREGGANAARTHIAYARRLGLPLFGAAATSDGETGETIEAGADIIARFGEGSRYARIVAPHASFLALEFDFERALKNLRRAVGAGLYGRYGFYEACDFSDGGAEALRVFTARSRAAAVCATANLLRGGLLRELFISDARAASAELLLTERPDARRAEKKTVFRPSGARFETRARSAAPRPVGTRSVGTRSDGDVLILGRGAYSSVLYSDGTGFSALNGAPLIRERAGIRFYITEITPRGAKTFCTAGASCRAVVRGDGAEFDYGGAGDDLRARMFVNVPPEPFCETRVLILRNDSPRARRFSVVSRFGASAALADADSLNSAPEVTFHAEDNAVSVRRAGRAEKIRGASGRPILLHCVAGAENARGGGDGDCVFLGGEIAAPPNGEAEIRFVTGAVSADEGDKRMRGVFSNPDFAPSASARADMPSDTVSDGERRAADALARLVLLGKIPLAGLKRTARERDAEAVLKRFGADFGFPFVLPETSEGADGETRYHPTPGGAGYGAAEILRAAARAQNASLRFNLFLPFSGGDGGRAALTEAAAAVGLSAALSRGRGFCPSDAVSDGRSIALLRGLRNEL